MIMMAVGTFCIGLIPSYESIGIVAPILLLVARLVQGFPPVVSTVALLPLSLSIQRISAVVSWEAG